jgi:hypothetical protein
MCAAVGAAGDRSVMRLQSSAVPKMAQLNPAAVVSSAAAGWSSLDASLHAGRHAAERSLSLGVRLFKRR